MMSENSKKNKKYENSFDYFLQNNPRYWSWCKKIDEREDLSEIEKYEKKTEFDFGSDRFFYFRAYVFNFSFKDVVWMFVYSALFFALSIWIYRSFFEFSQDYTFYYVFALFSLAFFFFVISMLLTASTNKKQDYIENYLHDRMQMSEKHILSLLKEIEELKKEIHSLETKKLHEMTQVQEEKNLNLWKAVGALQVRMRELENEKQEKN